MLKTTGHKEAKPDLNKLVGIPHYLMKHGQGEKNLKEEENKNQSIQQTIQKLQS